VYEDFDGATQREGKAAEIEGGETTQKVLHCMVVEPETEPFGSHRSETGVEKSDLANLTRQYFK